MKMKWIRFANELVRKSEIKNVVLDKNRVIMHTDTYDYTEVYFTRYAADKRLNEVLRLLNRGW